MAPLGTGGHPSRGLPYHPHAPLHLRHKACLKGAARAQLLRGLPAEEQVLVHQLQQHEPHQLTHVLATNELLVPGQSTIRSFPVGRSPQRQGHEGRGSVTPCQTWTPPIRSSTNWGIRTSTPAPQRGLGPVLLRPSVTRPALSQRGVLAHEMGCCPHHPVSQLGRPQRVGDHAGVRPLGLLSPEPLLHHCEHPLFGPEASGLLPT